MGWCRRSEALMLSALMLAAWSCSARKHQVSPDFTKKLDAMREHAKTAVEDGINREITSPEEETAQRANGTPQSLLAHEPIWVQSGKSRVLQLKDTVQRVSIGNPDLAGIVVLGPRTIMINAKELPKVEAPPSSGVDMGQSGVILGRTLTAEPHMAETTLAIWTEDGGYDVHTLTIANFLNQQVLLEVTVAELNRTAMEQYGVDFRAVQNDFIAAYFLGAGAGASPAGKTNTIPPQITQPLLPLSLGTDRPTFAFIFPNEDVSTLVEALQTEGLATVLAQPKITAMSGQNAVFQVGGEIPIRIATGFAANIEFKPFGTLVNFVPRVSEDGDIMLTVTPELSEPDFSNTVEGIPSFITRRASTSTRLRNGQTLVIGGLMQMKRQEQVAKVPYLGDIPFVGWAFRQTSYTSSRTELMVIVKPSLVHPLPAGEQMALPTDRGPLTNEEIRPKPNRAEVTRPRIPGLP